MHRCWLGEIAPLTVGQTVTLSAEESAHVGRVLRMKPGEPVQLIAAERLYAGELITVGERAAVRVLAQEPSPEAAARVTLVQGLPKLDKLELIIQKATELGVWDVWPVGMARSIARLDAGDTRKPGRWTRIALEAAKQSGRAHVPEIRPMANLTEAVAALREAAFDAVLVAWEEEGEHTLSAEMRALLMQNPNPRAIAIVIGPEGGIAPSEIERLQTAGARCVSLGRRILRTETAGLCGLSVIMSTLGEL